MQTTIRRAGDGAGGLVVIGGPAGIGKTALLQAAAGMAERAGMRVLRARATDLEQEFAFGVVRQLFEAPLARAGAKERAALLRGAAALAGRLFEAAPAGRGQPRHDRPGHVDPGDGQPEHLAPAGPTGEVRTGMAGPADRVFTLVHSLYWLTSNLSSTGSVALVVDDSHWADPPSLRFLAYVSARSEQLGALVIVTVRDGEPSAVQELLVAVRADPRATLIEPASLSDSAVAMLVRSGLGEHADAGVRAACARASAGNPFLVRELIAELATERVEPVAASVSRIESVRSESVSRAVVARLNRLGADSRNLARSVAVLENASLRQAATLAGIPGTRARRAADRLISAQILAPSASLAFVHPLVQRAVYERIPAAALADGHRRAGLLLAAEGARSTRVGAHLLRGEPAGDPGRRAAARGGARARADGAPQTAVRLLRRTLGAARGRGARSRARGARRSRGAGARSSRRGPPAGGARARRGAGDPGQAGPDPQRDAHLGRAPPRGARRARPDDRRVGAHGRSAASRGARDATRVDGIRRSSACRRDRAPPSRAARARDDGGAGRARPARVRRVLAGGLRAVLRELARAARNRTRPRAAGSRGVRRSPGGQIRDRRTRVCRPGAPGA